MDWPLARLATPGMVYKAYRVCVRECTCAWQQKTARRGEWCSFVWPCESHWAELLLDSVCVSLSPLSFNFCLFLRLYNNQSWNGSPEQALKQAQFTTFLQLQVEKPKPPLGLIYTLKHCYWVFDHLINWTFLSLACSHYQFLQMTVLTRTTGVWLIVRSSREPICLIVSYLSGFFEHNTGHLWVNNWPDRENNRIAHVQQDSR